MDTAEQLYDIFCVLGFVAIFAILWFADQVRVKGIRAAFSHVAKLIRGAPRWIATEWF